MGNMKPEGFVTFVDAIRGFPIFLSSDLTNLRTKSNVEYKLKWENMA